MTSNEKSKVQYLGDGLYADFDGYQFELLANDPKQPTDRVYLEPSVALAFIKYMAGHGVFMSHVSLT